MKGIVSNALEQVRTCARTGFKDAQHLTREQMKKVMGGLLAPTVDTS